MKGRGDWRKDSRNSGSEGTLGRGRGMARLQEGGRGPGWGALLLGSEDTRGESGRAPGVRAEGQCRTTLLSRGPWCCLETLGAWLDWWGRVIRQVPGGQAPSRGEAHMAA